ncbi:BtrH N-terminal domain-containing protein [Streptomyces coeruleorubidus]|uniref:BtrH N-terminal domain-containing protein n=1 Tax=Streptomyces coeruleorubidus TaxID=116188 RepID=UPI00237F1DEA|nr:BtrH N-terminal domain-containing protein [Streptomyces coeruleorubidus]WDV54262.1 BtrH N-terminal domain-containing protein [Streptomyces coeruleorubidus]
MTVDVTARTYMITGPEPEWWYRDLVSCLQSTFGSLLIREGADPLSVLGAGWRFLHLPGDVRSEEFYYPCPPDESGGADLGAALAPHHALRARWWQPADEDDVWREVRETLADDRLVIAAVDNYHLPFRPAYGDVHAAHLVVVYGLDETRGVVYVSDAMPPAFRGAVPIEEFLRSWGSANPTDVQDAFFSDARIGRRCLDVRLDAPPAPLTPELLGGFLRTDVDGFTTAGSARTGLAGYDEFAAELLDRCRASDAGALRELYPFGWGMQAQASLHGELLRRCGRQWDDPALAGAGRAVEAVAHAWTGLRFTGAHGLEDPRAVAPDIAHHATLLRGAYARAVDAVGAAAARL